MTKIVVNQINCNQIFRRLIKKQTKFSVHHMTWIVEYHWLYIVYDNSTVPTSELFEYYTAFKLLSHSISSRIDLTFQTYIFPHREHSFLPKHAVFQLRGWLQGRGDRVLRGVHVGPWEILETRSVALSSYSLSLFLVASHLFVPVVKLSGARLFRFSVWAPTYVMFL